jgi:hypothetical protein
MWCDVQICRGPTGERLRRAEWRPIGLGDLTIYPAAKGQLAASLDRLDIERRYQITPPIGDVRVVTYGAGMLVVGYQIAADTANDVTREYRQAWYCVPVAGP